MRIVFVGATRFGLRCLAAARAVGGIEIVGAVTAPPRFTISYRPEGVSNVLHAQVEPFCRSHHIPCHSIGQEGMRGKDLLDQIKAWRPDGFLVAGWFHMIPKAWRDVAPAYGLHASLLPDYSGGAPLVWAMINGERETGITLFQLGDGVDDGPIVGQARTPIRADDDIATLYSRIEELGIDLIAEHLPDLATGKAVLVAQDESARRIVPQRGPEDGLIDWNQPAQRVHDFIRAQTRPYPGAFAMHRGEKVHVWATRPSSILSSTVGLPVLHDERLVVGCGDLRSLEVTAISVDGVDSPPTDWWRAKTEEGQHLGFA